MTDQNISQADWLAGIAAAGNRFGNFEGIEGLAKKTGNKDALSAQAQSLAEDWRKQIEDADQPRAPRLVALRRAMADHGLAGLIIPHNDEYQNEYLPLGAQRLAWLTGFTGSAGLCILLKDKAAVWSDGRYSLQLESQVDGALFERKHISDDPALPWLKARVMPGDAIGFDPWLHTPDDTRRWREAVETAGGRLVSCENLIDQVWGPNKPPAPLAPLAIHDLRHAGETADNKRMRLAQDLRTANIKAAVITAPDSIAWLLNLRGSDVAHTPICLARAILYDDGLVDLFVDDRKVTDAVRAHLGNSVSIQEESSLENSIAALGRAKARLRLDSLSASEALRGMVERHGAQADIGADPCQLPKACKNEAELAGARAAHIRDGAAVTNFLHWLSLEAPTGRVDELGAAEALLGFRRATGCLIDLSFPSISGAGPNGAIIHYRSTPTTNRRLNLGELYLIDSGAQYLDGTTDITRTVVIGEPTEEMRIRFTAVLRGHIALGAAAFPHGTTGSQLDSLARQHLWQLGLDYDHGTGHGVGSFLSVHEGPARISKIPNATALRPGMILSNEPGYYKPGAYGIRIENLVAVEAREKVQNAERAMLGFETLTLAPIDRRLIRAKDMTADERAWIDAYHARVYETLAPLLDGKIIDWLKGETAPI